MDSLALFQQSIGCSSSNPVAVSIDDTSWLKAEITAKEILQYVLPTIVSEQKRMAVIDYIRRIFKTYPESEVYPLGSLPLKTYLPDGDIDLSAFCCRYQEQNLADYVLAVLEREEQNCFAEYEVRNVHYINAKVKLIKCNVQHLSLDISFNQLGGLKKLWFLEQVDQQIGKNHIFKRSIIFIKSWCYYESRILGSRHCLLSSYALETLTLYIFQLFHSSIDGPLFALYRFLDYYENFDWDKYCISLSGPVCLSSLPEILVENPEKDEGELLLSKEYLKYCADMCSVPQNMHETKPFLPKYMNIIDPLKENNNLGRNISEANFYRIRSCFSYGAKAFRKILALPEERIAIEIRKLFLTIIRRHGSGYRLDVDGYVSSGSVVESTFHAKDSLQEGIDHNRISSESCPETVETSSINTELGISIGCYDTKDSLADLGGDYECHLTSSMNADCCITGASTVPVLHGHPKFPSQNWYDQSHIRLNLSSRLEHNAFDNVDASELVPESPVYSERVFMTPGALFGGKKMQTRRGLGTFFPRTVKQDLMPVTSDAIERSNDGVHIALSEKNPDKGNEEWGQEEIQIPSVENKLLYTVTPENNRTSHNSSTPECTISSQTPLMQGVNLKEERYAPQSYILEDNNDFPPLSAFS